MDKEEYKKPKQTQGQKKMAEYLKDLLKNEVFLNEIDEANKLEGYKQTKAFIAISERYNLLFDMGSPLMHIGLTRKYELEGKESPFKIDFDDMDLDVCILMNDYNHHYLFRKGVPLRYDYLLRSRISAFPVSIAISPFASKRDVLDFITKRWNYIHSMQDEERGIVKVKKKRELYDFIWDNKDMPKNELEDLVADKFPVEAISYADIYKIISTEKKRRTSEV